MSAAAYPLKWPKGWPKTEPGKKEDGRFNQSLATALNNLKTEVVRLGGKNLVLSSNYTLGADRPAESGVVAYFQLDQASIAVPCDRWKLVEHNIRAIALTIEAMRGMERWGAKHMISAMFSGFKALPEKGSGVDPYEIMGLKRGQEYTEKQITDAFREQSKVCHPDKPGGSNEKWLALRESHDLIMQNVLK
jgi:hypothetical protein